MIDRIRARGAEKPARRIRVVQVTHDLGLGGLPQVVKTLALALDRERFDVSVLCLNEMGPLADDLLAGGVPVEVMGRRRGMAGRLASLRVRRAFQRLRPDVVHTHNIQPLWHAGLGAALTGVRTIIHTDHARSFPDELRYMILEHFLSYLVYRMVGVSEHTTECLAKYEWIPRRKLVTIPNGIDGTRYRTPIDRRSKRAELQVGDGLVLGFAARLEEQKGLCYLIEGLPELQRRVGPVTVLVAGAGPLAESLKQLARATGVSDQVRFLGERRDLHELYQIFDVFVLPSLWEGLPMTVLEALAARCPVVASGVGGVPAAITHGSNGSLVPSRSTPALVDELARVLGSEAIRERYRSNGLATFLAGYDARVMARRYEALYLRKPLDVATVPPGIPSNVMAEPSAVVGMPA